MFILSFFYALKAIWQRRRRLRKRFSNDKKSSLSTENIIDAKNEVLRQRPRAPTPTLSVEYEDPDVLEMSQEGSVVPSRNNDAMISTQEGRSPLPFECRSATDPSESSASPAQLHPERNMNVSKHPRATSQEVSNDVEPDTREAQTIEKPFGQASNRRFRKEPVTNPLQTLQLRNMLDDTPLQQNNISLTDKESFEFPGNQGQPLFITSFDDVEPKYLNSNRSEYSNIPPPVPEQRNDSGAYVSPLTLQSFSRSVPERNSTSGKTDEHGYVVCFL